MSPNVVELLAIQSPTLYKRQKVTKSSEDFTYRFAQLRHHEQDLNHGHQPQQVVRRSDPDARSGRTCLRCLQGKKVSCENLPNCLTRPTSHAKKTTLCLPSGVELSFPATMKNCNRPKLNQPYLNPAFPLCPYTMSTSSKKYQKKSHWSRYRPLNWLFAKQPHFSFSTWKDA